MTFEIRDRQWLLVTVEVSRDFADIAASLLFELGSTGIITLAETTDAVKLGAYFDQEVDAQRIKRWVEEGLDPVEGRVILFGLSLATVPDQDWLQTWKDQFDATRIGGKLVVAPSWKVPALPIGDRLVIQIDPGMAFGTGTHETTRLCLEAIERHWRGGSLLDVGTGTGILAIAAALLAPGSRVIAIDVDPDAVEIAAENVEINGVSSSLDVLLGQPGRLGGETFDVVVANLTAEVIVDLMDGLTGCVAPHGALILSGILTELAGDVERSLVSARFNITERREAGEWCALLARRA